MTGRLSTPAAALAAILLLAIASVPTTLVHAASAATDDGGATDATLQDVTITARKVPENAQLVPVSVVALTGADLTGAGILDIAHLDELAPGLTLREAPPAPSALEMELRGQLQNDTLATEDPAIGTYVDAVYWARAYGLNQDLLDVKDAQILYGPQGTLFGRNTTGGAIVVQTRDPQLDAFSGLASLGGGSFGERDGTLILNVPIIAGALGMRAAIGSSDRDGYITNSLDGDKLASRKRWTGRIKILYVINDRLTELVSAEIFHMRDNANPFRLSYAAPPDLASLATANPNIGSLLNLQVALAKGLFVGTSPNVIAASQLVQQYIASAQGDTVAMTQDWPIVTETRTFSSTTRYSLGWGALRFIGAYRSVAENTGIDLEGSPFQGINATFHRDLTQWSGELQFTGDALDHKLNVVAGLLYFAEHGLDLSHSQALPVLIPTTTVNDGDISNRSVGIYAQNTYHITRKLSVTGGLRFSSDDKGLITHNRTLAAEGTFGPSFPDAMQLCNVVPLGPAAYGAIGAPCSLREDRTFSALSYTLGTDYRLTDDLMAYLKTSKGFRSGGQNLRGGFYTIGGQPYPSIAPFKPEIERDVELGIKSQLWNGRARANLALYHSWNSDIQKTLIVVTDQTPDTIVVNAGKQEVSGMEAQFALQALATARDSALLGLSGAYTDPRYTHYIDPVTGANLANSRFEGVPRWTAVASIAYEHRFAAGRLTLHGDYSWRSEMALQPYNDTTDPYNQALIDATTSPAVGFVNARASVVVMSDRLELALWGDNLTDERIATNALEFGAPLDVVSTLYSPPRTYGATVTYRFGARE